MTRLTYPVVLRPDDNDTYLVSFPDFPEAHTFGDTKEEALERAVDALATAIDAYIADRRDIPAPSPIKKWSVALPLLMGTKVLLYKSMREAGVGKAELARRLDVHLPQVDRLLNVRHSSQLGQLEAAFDAIGRRVEVVIVDDVAAAKLKEYAKKMPRPRRAVPRSTKRKAHEVHA